jgi:hypothetical protein
MPMPMVLSFASMVLAKLQLSARAAWDGSDFWAVTPMSALA